jgi:alkylation response protein AidB-like acyl-CoA dehydrogenase
MKAVTFAFAICAALGTQRSTVLGTAVIAKALPRARRESQAMSVAANHAAASDEEAMILEVVRQLVKERVEPRAAEIDESGEFPWDVKELFAESDLLGIPFPAEYGGLGGSFVTYVKVVEEIAKACASSSLIIAVQELGALPILIGGTDEQKRRWIPDLASGAKIAAYALTEPGSGSDAAGSMRTKAERDGDGFVLNGTKIWITQGNVADVVTVFAVTDPAKGPNGISAFVVEKGTPGFHVGKVEKKMGIRGSPTVELSFNDCRVPAANLLGGEGEGFKIAMKVLDKSRPGIAAQALGIAQGALDYATEYTKGRIAFGKPIAQQQGIQFMLADMKTEVEGARLLLYEAARRCDENAPDVTTWAAMAKLKCGDVAMSVTTDAVQLLGGYGYSTEYPVERMMRDAKITQIYEGTQQIQRIVIARSMVGKWRPPQG